MCDKDSESKKFVEHIHSYNNAFSFAYMRAQIKGAFRLCVERAFVSPQLLGILRSRVRELVSERERTKESDTKERKHDTLSRFVFQLELELDPRAGLHTMQ